MRHVEISHPLLNLKIFLPGAKASKKSDHKACVGLCYYNKLKALEEKEDLTHHNFLYKHEEVGL